MEGYLRLYRKLQDHWLYEKRRPKTKLEAWIHILFTVNYKPLKSHIRGVIYDCDRGQSIYSLDTWAKEFNWSIQQVRTYFKQLEKDEMITIEGLQYTTRLTVCNYDMYQFDSTDEKHTEQQAANMPLTGSQHAANNKRNKENKENKEKNIIYPPEVVELNTFCLSYFDSKYVNTKTIEAIEKLVTIDKYTPEQIKTAIKLARGDQFWAKNFLTPKKLRDTDKNGVKYIDRFLNIAPKNSNKEIEVPVGLRSKPITFDSYK